MEIKRIQENIKIQGSNGAVNELKNSLWYGGVIAEAIVTDKVKMLVVANGDVIGDIYEGSNYIGRIKDKYNQGNFYEVVTDYTEISSDNELEDSLTNYMHIDAEVESEFESRKYSINLSDNNWFEFELYIDNTFIPIGDMDSIVADATHTDEAIVELTDSLQWILECASEYDFKDSDMKRYIDEAIESLKK